MDKLALRAGHAACLAMVAVVLSQVSLTDASVASPASGRIQCGFQLASDPPATPQVILKSVTGTKCKYGLRVLHAVSKWIDVNRPQDLGAYRHRNTLGYRCAVRSSGDFSWAIVCRRGKTRVIYGSAVQ